MKRSNKIILSVIVIAVLLIGIGYAAITSVTLNISGTAAADPSQSNFQVKFTGETNESDETKVTAGVTDDTNATIKVVGLSAKGESEYAEYTIQNVSKDISADLEVKTTNNNEDYFKIESKLEKTSLKAGEVTKVKVTVELLKTPIQDNVQATVGVQITASPVEPGKEGSTQTPETPEEPEPDPIKGQVVDGAYNVDKYGWKVNGYTTAEEEVGCWRLFYQDEEYTYIISDNLIPLTDTLYNLYTAAGWGTKTGADVSEIGKKLNQLAVESDIFTSTKNPNILGVGYLTDQDIWKKYKGEGAEYAIGGPSLELLAKSFNVTSTLNNRDKTMTPEVTNGYGYTYSGAGGTSNFFLAEWNKGIYRKGTSGYWWLSSPSVDDGSHAYVICVDESWGWIGASNVTGLYSSKTDSANSVRPLVLIPTSEFNEKYLSTLEDV